MGSKIGDTYGEYNGLSEVEEAPSMMALLLAEDLEAPAMSMMEGEEAPGLFAFADEGPWLFAFAEETPGLSMMAFAEEAPGLLMEDVEAPSTSKVSISSIIQE